MGADGGAPASAERSAPQVPGGMPSKRPDGRRGGRTLGSGSSHAGIYLGAARRADITAESANRIAARLTIVGPVGVLNEYAA